MTQIFETRPRSGSVTISLPTRFALVREEKFAVGVSGGRVPVYPSAPKYLALLIAYAKGVNLRVALKADIEYALDRLLGHCVFASLVFQRINDT